MRPILGIAAVLQEVEENSRPFGELTALFEAIHHAALEKRINVFIIPPQPIRAKTKLLNGYTLHNGDWLKVTGRCPDVVYNRIATRALEQSAACQSFLNTLHQKTKGRLFNRTGFFSKLATYSILHKKRPQGLHLPLTVPAKSPEQIVALAKNGQELWLKPNEGSLGRGVYRLIREPYGFSLESSDDASSEQVDETEIRKKLQRVLTAAPYLVQEGIHRSEYDLRPFDLRVVLQRNGMGKFCVSNHFARLADHGQIVTNLFAGGDGVSLTDLLTEQERKRLRSLSIACANRLAAALPGPIGELGLDFGFDQDRQFWLIEANSKPRLKMTQGDPTTALIANRIVEYATYLLERPPLRNRKTATPPPASPSRKPVPREPKDH